MRSVLFLALISIFHLLNSQSVISIPDFKETPKINWIFSTDKSFYSSPVSQDNTVFIGGLDSILYSVDINTGKEKWQFHTNGEIR